MDIAVPALLETAARHGARPWVTWPDTVWRFADAPGIAARAAGALAAIGVRPGDTVALMSNNRRELAAAVLGCGWMGAIAAPLGARLRGATLAHALNLSGARLLLIENPLREELRAIPPWDGTVVAIEGFGEGPALPPGDVTPATPLAILGTSGTTGPAKAVICPQAQLAWWGVNTAALLEITEADVLATALPLHHVNALNTLFQGLVTGASVVVLDRFSVSRSWEQLAACGATVTYLLGAMVGMLMSRAPSAAERAHRVRVALAPGTPPALQETLRERTGIVTVDGYGSTETNFVIGVPPGEQRPGWMGTLRPGFASRIEAETGVLWLKSDQKLAFAAGYWRDAAATQAAWQDGWFRTGDAVAEQDGWFRFVGRTKDFIRRRGENIAAHEVEEALRAHADVADAAAYAVPSPLGEEEVMATVVLRAGAAPDAAALAAHARHLLPRFAVPRFLAFTDALPVTETGKVRKAELAALGTAAAVWDAEAPV
jgi:crotonobetaine/carnitine-CoA ligase